MASEQAAFAQKLKDAVETLLDSYVRILQAAKLGARVSVTRCSALPTRERFAGVALPCPARPGPARPVLSVLVSRAGAEERKERRGEAKRSAALLTQCSPRLVSFAGARARQR
jgi:hypothetical protein